MLAGEFWDVKSTHFQVARSKNIGVEEEKYMDGGELKLNINALIQEKKMSRKLT